MNHAVYTAGAAAVAPNVHSRRWIFIVGVGGGIGVWFYFSPSDSFLEGTGGFKAKNEKTPRPAAAAAAVAR